MIILPGCICTKLPGCYCTVSSLYPVGFLYSWLCISLRCTKLPYLQYDRYTIGTIVPFLNSRDDNIFISYFFAFMRSKIELRRISDFPQQQSKTWSHYFLKLQRPLISVDFQPGIFDNCTSFLTLFSNFSNSCFRSAFAWTVTFYNCFVNSSNFDSMVANCKFTASMKVKI